MKDDDVISFGDALTYKWKHITIDPPRGLPILLNGKEIGGFFIRLDMFPPPLNVVAVEGIELDPEYRGHGIGTEVINMLIEQCDMLVGSITEDEPKPFWRKLGAEFRDIPLQNFPDKMLHTIHTKHPKFFFITKNPEAKAMAEFFAKEIPDLMLKEKQGLLQHANN